MENLEIYKEGLKLVTQVYQLVNRSSDLRKDFSLCDQIKRASVSIPTNISEGYKRTKKQFVNYLRISMGSVNEVVTLLKIISLVYKIETSSLQNSFVILGRRIASFSKSIDKNNY